MSGNDLQQAELNLAHVCRELHERLKAVDERLAVDGWGKPRSA